MKFGVISGRESAALTHRASELDFDEIHQRVHDKLGLLNELLSRHELTRDQVCFVGDDLIDLPVMRRVGFAAAPADALPE
ncbi:MAG: phenylphosphate carboxylase subunit delta, partial [Actinobacteria bacterium]|nr:phenylphosphate carboxylase subunit delta [Actinomycetota bacterium]